MEFARAYSAGSFKRLSSGVSPHSRRPLEPRPPQGLRSRSKTCYEVLQGRLPEMARPSSSRWVALWQLGGRRVLRGVRREYRAASRRAARTRGFAATAFAGSAFVEGATYLRLGTGTVKQSITSFTASLPPATRSGRLSGVARYERPPWEHCPDCRSHPRGLIVHAAAARLPLG
jgi:hypothetical protein